MSEDATEKDIKTRIIEIVGTRWVRSLYDDTALCILMAVGMTNNQRMVIARTCANTDNNRDQIVQGVAMMGSIIHRSDAEMIAKFLNDAPIDKLFESTKECTYKVDFYRWTIWLCELMKQPPSYGVFLVAEPTYRLLFEGDTSPNEAFALGCEVGEFVERDGRWHLADEDETAEIIGMTAAQLEESWHKDDQPPF